MSSFDERGIDRSVHVRPDPLWEGDVQLILTVEPPAAGPHISYEYSWHIVNYPAHVTHEPRLTILTTQIAGSEGLPVGAHHITVHAKLRRRPDESELESELEQFAAANLPQEARYSGTLIVQPRTMLSIPPSGLPVALQSPGATPTDDTLFWDVIRSRTKAISFENYAAFIDKIMCPPNEDGGLHHVERTLKDFPMRLPFPFVDAYTRLKVATEIFVMFQCGLRFDRQTFPNIGLELDDRAKLEALRDEYLQNLKGDPSCRALPYFGLIESQLLSLPLKSAAEAGPCYAVLRYVCDGPCLLELIWSYWHEQGMLVQTMNALSRRFQNIRGPGDNDPLAYLEIDPLRPINNLLWGYVQDEQHRLTVARRAFEYEHQYGLTLFGKAIPTDFHAADRRSKFLEAFHNLLYWTMEFYKEFDDKTVTADAFRLLHALKEMQLLLTEGMQNQFGDLPSTARMEMLMQQWLLARPEMWEFLGGRPMIPYREPWMGRVDRMKTMQGWSDVNVTHFADLGRFGEQLLLSIRYGAWAAIDDMASAANWANSWRAEVQGYIHAYRAVTGVDLGVEQTGDQASELRSMQPSELLRRRIESEAVPALPGGSRAALPASRPNGERRALPASQSPQGVALPARRARGNGQG